MFFKKNDPEKICSLCANAKLIADSENVLCNIKGVVSCNFTCKKFRYDLLKRNPGRLARLDSFEYVDINE